MKDVHSSLQRIGMCVNALLGIAVVFLLSVFLIGENRLIPPSLFTIEGRAKRAEIEVILTKAVTVSDVKTIAIMAPYGSTLDAMAHDRWEELSETAVASASTHAEREDACKEAPLDVKYSSACKKIYMQQELNMIESLSG